MTSPHQRIRQKYWVEETQFVSLKLWAGACEYHTKGTQTTTLTYLSGPGGLYALHLINPDESESICYIHTDHLGSWTAISDDTGTIINEQSYDAWGNRRSPSTWTKAGMAVQSPLFDRGFTGHEHLDGFQLINMNGRMYDPVVSRMLAPDNFVQTPDFSQNFNRYSYAMNNPLRYTDPDGEWVHLVVGGIIGGIQGYKIGQAAGLDGWDLAGITLAGAGVGALTGGIANSIATGGGVLANTIAIAAASHTNSVGMSIIGGIAGVEVPYTLSVGAASMTIGSQGIEYGYIGKPGNSSLANIGYGFGALANLADVLAGIKPGSVELRTENDPNYYKTVDANGNPIPHKDLIGHSQITDANGKPLVDWGPTQGVDGFGDWVSGTNTYENGFAIPASKMKWSPLTIEGVNTGRISGWNPSGNYNLAINNCVSQTSRALNASGAFNIGIHPYMLHAQMYLRSIGVRPMFYSHYMIR